MHRYMAFSQAASDTWAREPAVSMVGLWALIGVSSSTASVMGEVT
jgi:hypothetical protein